MPPGALLTRADLIAASRSEPSKSTADLALERMELATALHMPPSPLASATADELAAFRSWMAQGMQAATCDQVVDPAPDPYDTPVVCSSERQWTGGNQESPLMRPGGACINCHDRKGEGPVFAVAGTVYFTPHEPDDCYGAQETPVVVVVIDAAGTESRLTPNRAGNFFLEDASFQFPYSAKIEYGGRTRVMVEQQTDGDCNGCHTEQGTEKAPGRTFLP